MKNIKIILMLLIMLVLCITIGIAVLILSSQITPGDYTDETEYEPTIIVNETLEKVTSRNNYYTVKNIIEDYYDCLCRLNETEENVLIYEEDVKEENNTYNEVKSIQKENIKKRIFSYFEEDCINEIGLTINNIQEKLGNYNDIYILIDDMYVRDITETVNIYFVSGNLIETESLKKEKFGFMISIDTMNSTFNIYTSDYAKNNNLLELSKEKEFKEKYFNVENIENRTYNKYDFKIIDNETYYKDLLKTYIQSIKYNDINYSYNRLDEEYRAKKFPNISDYQKFIEENKKTIITSNLKQYKENKYDGYKQYICIDQNGKYYIFNEKSAMNYTLILDEYTVDLPEFIEHYKTATPEKRVGMNIEKIISAINNKDYRYVYSKLDNTFKNSQFPTQDSLKSYIEKKLYDKNNIEYAEFSEDGGLYIYKTKITNKNISDSQSKNLNIIMQLGEGTNFTMSFSVE